MAENAGSTDGSESAPRRSCIQTALLLAAFFGIAILLQRHGGAYQAEFGSEPDEAAHYITGLCVRDYIAGGFRETANPLGYAKKYYEHYPKVALGHWPPVFYLIQSAWTIPFSPSRTSVMLLMAFLTALIAAVLFSTLQKVFDYWQAIFGALLFLVLPLTQRFSMAVMTEIPIALFALCATISFGKFLDSERTCDAVWFGVFASLAILTKQSALALAFVPVFGILFTRKFYLLKRLSFWSSAIVVFLLCAPWNLLTYKFASEGWADEGWGWAFMSKAITFYPQKLHLTLDTVVTFLALTGLVAIISRPQQNKPVGLWFAAGGLLMGVVLFHIVVPVGFEDRHLIPALPAVVLLAAAGLNQCGELAWLRNPALRIGLVIVLAVTALSFCVIQIPHKGYRGFGDAAEFLLSKRDATKEKFLVASDARGEGQFISEIAMREKRPGHIIKRGSKELASSSWSGGGYKAKFENEAALANFLQTNSIRYVVLDTSLGGNARKDYHELLARAMEQGGFALEKSFAVERAGKLFEGALRVYRTAKNSP